MLRSARIAPTTVRLARGYASSASNVKAAEISALSQIARQYADEVSSKWAGTSATGGNTKNFIGGQFTDSKAKDWLEVRDPVSTDKLISSCSDVLWEQGDRVGT